MRSERGLLIAGGACAIAWPILSEVLFFFLYPIAAGGSILPSPGGSAAILTQLAETGQRPAVLALEWGRVAGPLLLLPFLLAIYQLLSKRGQRNLAMVGVSLGLVSMVLLVFSHTFNPALSHALGQAYVDAGSAAEASSIQAISIALLRWRSGLNSTISFLYQACVALISLALVRSRTWRGMGWLGLVGALLAIPAKLPIGIRVPTNFLWTGLGYFFWPIGLGIGLLREGRALSDAAKGMD